MHTQADTAQWIRGRGGHYLLTPLDNQKTLRRTLKALPFKSVPSISWVDTSHGRRVRRTVKALEVPKRVDFPGSAQVVQVRRTRTVKGRKRVEVVYLVCSLPMTDAQPEAVAAWGRGHWGGDREPSPRRSGTCGVRSVSRTGGVFLPVSR